MSGYTPLFASLTTGTLCGRWPDIGLWPIVLSLADKHGVVDVTPAYISGVTGLPVPEVVACMKRFCEPDLYSRSPADQGARLALLDEHRDWGWRIVNHGLYRERARKMAYDAERTANGWDAERKRTSRGMSRDVPRCPDESRDGPTSPPASRSQTQTQTQTEEEESGARAPARGDAVQGLDLKSWERWLAYRQEIRRAIKPVSIPAAQRKLAGFGADQAAVVEQSIANGWQGLFELRRAPGSVPRGPSAEEAERTSLEKLKQRRPMIGLADFRDPLTGESADAYRAAQNAQWNARQKGDRSPAVAKAVADLAAAKRVAS